MEEGFDFIAASFVRSAADVREIRQPAGQPQVPASASSPRSRIRRACNNLDGDPGGGGRHHGGPRRHGRGDRLHGDPRHPEEYDRPVRGRRQAGHHCHPDAGLHDREPPAHPCGDHRRGQRHLRRHQRHHALRRDGGGPVPGGGGADHGRHCPENRIPHRRCQTAGTAVPQPHEHHRRHGPRRLHHCQGYRCRRHPDGESGGYHRPDGQLASVRRPRW